MTMEPSACMNTMGAAYCRDIYVPICYGSIYEIDGVHKYKRQCAVCEGSEVGTNEKQGMPKMLLWNILSINVAATFLDQRCTATYISQREV